MIYADTADRVAEKYRRHAAVKATGVTLLQLEILQHYIGALSPRQRQIWAFVVEPISRELGDWPLPDPEEEEDGWDEVEA